MLLLCMSHTSGKEGCCYVTARVVCDRHIKVTCEDHFHGSRETLGGLYDGHGEICNAFLLTFELTTSLTNWMNFRSEFFFFSLLLSFLFTFPYTLLPSPLARSAMWQKTSTLVKSDIETEPQSVSGPNPQSLSACQAPLHGCFFALSAVQPGRDMHPPCPLLSSAPCSAQMSTQFTAHTKLDHFSGVLCRPRTCCFPPSLIND